MSTDTGSTPHVKITLADIWHELQLVRAEVADMKAANHTADLRADVADHEARIRSLEKWVWRAAGLAAAVGLLGGGVLGDIVGKLGG